MSLAHHVSHSFLGDGGCLLGQVYPCQWLPRDALLSSVQSNGDIFDFGLTAEDMAAVDALNAGIRYCVPSVTTADGRIVPRDAAHPLFPFNIEF